MSRKLLVTAAISVVIVAVVIKWSAFAAEGGPASKEVVPDEFLGRIVHIQTTKRDLVLEEVEVVRLGKQWFLSGRGVKGYRNLWWEGVPVRVNLSSVVSYFPMTPKQYEESNSKRDE